MKKLMLIAAIVAMPLASVMAFHPDTDCSRCHIPHKAKDDAGVPLWNPEVGLDPTGVTFTNYESDTLDATVGDPTGSTLMCLGCHDGGAHYSVNSTGVSGDLSATHPIEFEYDAALVALDPELVDPTAAGSSSVVNGKGSISEDLLFGTAGATMNCLSCHDIHVQGLHEIDVQLKDATGNPTELVTKDIPHLVNMPGIEYKKSYRGDPSNIDDYSLSYSVLCRTCHIK